MTRHIRTHRALRVETLETRTAPTPILGTAVALSHIAKPILSPRPIVIKPTDSLPGAKPSGTAESAGKASWDIITHSTM